VVYVSTGSCSSLGLHLAPQLSTTWTMKGRVVVQFFCSQIESQERQHRVGRVAACEAAWQVHRQV
jgi:glutathione peroxidase-family protein